MQLQLVTNKKLVHNLCPLRDYMNSKMNLINSRRAVEIGDLDRAKRGQQLDLL
jgi:hypothetical protein